MSAGFYYNAMWGALQGNIAYECAEGGRDLSPTQMNLQKNCVRLYCQARDLMDMYGGRVEQQNFRQQSRVEWRRGLQN